MRTAKRRRREGKTDYKSRKNMLKSDMPRIVFRKTNRYIIGQFVKSEEARDSVIIGVNSKSLLDLGWPENLRGSLKSLPACYLAGFLLGKKICEKMKNAGAVLDIGLIRSIRGSRAYAFAKGVVDSGVKLKVKEEMLPAEERILGKHLKKNPEINKIKEKMKNG